MSSSAPASDTGFLYAAVTLLIWSSFVVVSRLGAESTLTAFDISALRIATAALVLSPWWLPRLLRPALRQLRWYQSLSFAMLAGIFYPLLAYLGFESAPASHGAVLISGMLPFFTSVLAFFLLGERPGRTRVLGLVLILSGVLTLLFSQHAPAASSASTLSGDLCLLGASAVWSLFTVLLKVWRVRAFDVTLGVSAFSALIYLPVFLLFLPSQLAQASYAEIGLQAFFQGFVVVCVAMWTYARAVELLGSVRVVIMMSGVPVVGVLLAIPVLGEALSAGSALGTVLVFLGALLGAMNKPEAAATPVGKSST
ncbi:DMT family transporter [Perlucidibaca piscinae]|uniref:DMT family transporter n=1 Tax=Perlucidibaca piscinae TaxID=392589 RepID=UPI0003B5A279|nr:DMT family transporter [Perlucidibaca piscinae]